MRSPRMERFYPYSRYLRETFGGKTLKIVVASGLTCPTRDGTLASRGCAFCDVQGSASFHGTRGRGAPVAEQLRKRLPDMRERFGATRFLAYFQSYTNTYGDTAYLRRIYEEAVSVEGIDGLCVGTRPDCLPDDVIALLAELSERTHVALELGAQSFDDPTLLWLERGHDARRSLDALERLAREAPKVHSCVHLMFGQPTDPPRIARDSARLLNASGARGVKLHQLMVLDRTALADRWRSSPFPTLTVEEYAARVAELLDHLSPGIYVERLSALAPRPEECLAPLWSRERWQTHNRLRALLEELGCVQGRLLSPAEERPEVQVEQPSDLGLVLGPHEDHGEGRRLPLV